MATLRTSIQMHDGMTPALRSMQNTLDIVINSFESLQDNSARAIDTNSIKAAHDELESLGATLDIVDDNIEQAKKQQEQFNESIRNGQGEADELLNKIRNIAATFGAAIGLNKIKDLSDDLAQSKARLSLIVDDGGSVDALQQKIFASAQAARGSYMDTMKTVSKLALMAGKSFSGNDEIIRFTELMNKNFSIGGASIQEQTSAMYQLTQAMAAGKLQGDEFRSIIENAPLLAKSIEEYMQNANIEGTMKDWASEGLLTADVIKNALFTSADEIEARFASMPTTWGQVITAFKNDAIMAFQPILTKINELANNQQFQNFYNDTVSGLYLIGSIALWVFDIMTGMGSGIYENWSLIAPVVLGVVGVMTAYHAILLTTNAIEAISNSIKIASALATGAKTVALGGETVAIGTATAAQWGLNAALLACPITWIIIGIIALIAIFYLAVAAVNRFAGTSISATGVIAGAFAVMAAFVFNNAIVPLWNGFAMFANFIGNVFHNPAAAVKVLFYDMAQTVIGYILNMARAIENIINKIPGVSVNITGGLEGFYNQLGAAAQQVKDESGWKEHVKKLDYQDYSAAYNKGYEWGSNIGSSFDLGKPGDLPQYDPAGQMAMNDALGGIGDNTGKTADNTGKMRDALDITGEELKYLRDLAEQEAINRYTTASLKVEMTNHNSINSNLDLDGIIGDLTDGVSEVVNSAAEGVHK